MKITIERFPPGVPQAPAGSRYLVIFDQPPHPSVQKFAHNEAWHPSLAAAITYIQGITEIAG